jgi:hypothetical protein
LFEYFCSHVCRPIQCNGYNKSLFRNGNAISVATKLDNTHISVRDNNEFEVLELEVTLVVNSSTIGCNVSIALSKPLLSGFVKSIQPSQPPTQS